MKEKKVYLLELIFVNEHGGPDIHTLGVYTSKEAARKAGQARGIEEVEKLWPVWRGIEDYFYIHEMELQS